MLFDLFMSGLLPLGFLQREMSTLSVESIGSRLDEVLNQRAKKPENDWNVPYASYTCSGQHAMSEGSDACSDSQIAIVVA